MKRRAVLGVLALLVLLVPLAALLLSCGGGGGSSSGGGTDSGTTSTGSVAVLLADGPADDYDHIYIWVTEVSLIPAAGSAAPVTIFQTNEFEDGYRGHKVDLLAYRDEDFILTVKKDVPAGKYAKIRLEISHIETVGGPCDDNWVKLPSGKIDLNPREPFFVVKGGTLSIRLDIDADKSINLHEAGNSGKCIFRPVVFVDIEEGAPVGRCPKIVSGKISQLLNDDSETPPEGFVLDLDGNRSQLEVKLSEQTAIFDEDGDFSDASALAEGQAVKVRGKLDDKGVLVASLVVIGNVFDVSGEVDGAVDATTQLFPLTPFSGEALVGQHRFKVAEDTLILVDCDTEVGPDAIQAGMTARVFYKQVSVVSIGDELRAVAIILHERRISGTITNLVEVDEPDTSKLATIDEFDNGTVQVFIPAETPVFLVGGKEIAVEYLCTGQDVRVVLDPTIADPLTAKVIFVEPEKHAGEVVEIDTNQRTLLVDEDGISTTTGDRRSITVPVGAKILKCEKEDGEQKEFLSFDDIEVGDVIVYFGLPVCGNSSAFNAFVVLVVDEYDDDSGDGPDYDYDDHLSKFVLGNNVNIHLRAGFFNQSLTVRGNNFHLTGEARADCDYDSGWTRIGGDVEVYGNNARFTNIKFLGTVRVRGNGVEFVNCCFKGGAPIYSK
jgi:hypothetical protein